LFENSLRRIREVCLPWFNIDTRNSERLKSRKRLAMLEAANQLIRAILK